ncbi:ABC transporter ATP-binding protein [Acidaminococcus massiliensis]|uniref:ABC transporter ATP-binding protein n=1 Tax=Acidaminococcus massiliensis TaxID=1852375 RepID=UPI0026DC2A1A|nr:ABC transporter ATP-binding protein [Acidaminococcus massiliensis]
MEYNNRKSGAGVSRRGSWLMMLRSLREFKKDALLPPITVMGEVVFEALIPYEIALLVNEVKAGCGLDRILYYAGILLLMALCALACGYVAGITCARASCGFAKNLRQDVFYQIQEFSFGNIDRFSSASLVTRLTTDIQNIQMAFMMLVRTAFRAPFNLLASFFMAWYMGGRMALCFLVVIPILGYGLYKIAVLSVGLFRKGFPQYDALNYKVEENIKGIRVVKSFVREETEIAKFDGTAREVQAIFTKGERYVALNNPLMQICIYGVMIFLLTQGSRLIVTTRGRLLDIGQFSTLLTYSFQILGSLMMLSMIMVMLTFTEESVQRVREVLEETSTLTSPADPVKTVRDGSVDFQGVSFQYEGSTGEPVLQDITLSVRSGEVVGIVGGTGSGKSSLVQLIPRLYDVIDGSIRVGGVDVRRYDLETLRENVAMVLQKNLLFSGTVADNLRWGNPHATRAQLEEACRWACADEFIRRLPKGYDTWIEQGGTNLSGGQKQRLCIARALLKRPRILILDDSTSAVDTRTDRAIWDALATALPGTTTFIIAQRLSSVERADRILVLDKGRIHGLGTHAELLRTDGIYQEMARSQNLLEKEREKEGTLHG